MAQRKTKKRTKNSALLYHLLAFAAGVAVGMELVGR